MKDLTVIIPLHEYDDTIGNSLMNAIESVKKQENDDPSTRAVVLSTVKAMNMLATQAGALADGDRDPGLRSPVCTAAPGSAPW